MAAIRKNCNRVVFIDNGVVKSSFGVEESISLYVSHGEKIKNIFSKQDPFVTELYKAVKTIYDDENIMLNPAEWINTLKYIEKNKDTLELYNINKF